MLEIDCDDGCITLWTYYNKKHWVAYFKWMNWVEYKFYLNKAVLREKSETEEVVLFQAHGKTMEVSV